LVDGAERYLALRDRQALQSEFNANTFDAGRLDARTFDAKTFDAKTFAAMPDEIRLRLLQRVIDRVGHEGPAELGKVEALLSALDRAGTENNARRRPGLKQTLAGALISLIDGRIRIEPAPPRRRSG
jgi:tRNA(Ile)-lysidine synthase